MHRFLLNFLKNSQIRKGIKILFIISILIILFQFISNSNFLKSNSLPVDSLTIKNPRVEIINSLTPVLSWFKSPGATKYRLVIKEFESSSFSSKPVLIRTFEVSDTFFLVPLPLLEDGKFYSWNVKAFNGNVWGDFGVDYYFRVDLKSKTSFIQEKPETISPGKYLPNIESINFLNPTFKWLKFSNAIGYDFVLEVEERKGSFVQIYSSEKFGLIKDTTFSISGNLFKSGKLYRWKIRALTKSGYSNFSEIRYFKIILQKSIPAPVIIYPGYKKEGKEIIATTTPTFVWKKIKEAESYSLAISQKGVDGKYKLIFDTEPLIKITDTSFTISNGILQNENFYRWNLKVILKDGRSIYSSRLYFKVSLVEKPKFGINEIQTTTEAESEFEEILLNMEYAGILKTFVSSIYYKDKFYVGLKEFLGNLQIPIKERKEEIIEGSLDEEDHFVIDFKDKKVQTPNFSTKFDDDAFMRYDENIYVEPQMLEKILSIKTELDFSTLTLKITGEKTLPIYRKFLIEQRLENIKRIKQETVYPLLFNRERYFLNGFIFDYSINQTAVKNQRSNYNASFSMGGELLWGDFYYQRQEFLATDSKSKIENLNWKYTFNPNKYLTQVILGDHFIDGLSSYAYRGISITNEVVEPRKQLGEYIFQESTEPNSVIELYLNNELVDIVKSDQSGNYLFKIPLRYGMSNYEFRIHTLKGETKTFRKLYQIPYDLLPKGIFNYRLTSGLIKFTNQKFGNGELSYGLNDYITLSTGADYIEDKQEKQLNYFGRSAFRVSSNIIFNLFYSPKFQTKIQGLLTTPNFSSYSFEYIDYKKNNFYNPAKLINSLRQNLYLPIKLKNSELSFYLTNEYLRSDFVKKYNLDFSTYFLYKWFGLSAGIVGENLHTSTLLKRRELSFSTSFNLNSLLRNIPVLNRSYIRGKTNYDLLNKEFLNFQLFAATTLFKNLRFQISYDRYLQVKISNFNLGLFLELPQARYLVTSNAKDVLNHQLSGSIGYSPQVGRFYLFSEPQIGRSAIYIEGFEDRNGNGIKDENEKNIKGVDFQINSASYSDKFKNGGKLFFGLNAYQEYIIKVNEAGLLSSDYSFEFPEFRIVTDGNRLKVLRLPFYQAGEINGEVVRVFEDEEIPISNVKLIIERVDGTKSITISTFSDGSFYYYGLSKGKYTIKIDENYLKRTALKSSPEKIDFEFDPKKNLLTLENLKFILK